MNNDIVPKERELKNSKIQLGFESKSSADVHAKY